MSIPQSPPPKNITVIEICSRSCALHAWPQAAKCSRKTFVDPYKKIRKLSTNSADGLFDSEDLIFQACRGQWCPMEWVNQLTHPISAKQPAHRPRVKMPYQKKTPPLIKCASPLKTSGPIYISISRCLRSNLISLTKNPPYVIIPVASAANPRIKIKRSTTS